MVGAVITQVIKGSLAEAIGLCEGDRIISVNGKKVRDLIEFQFEWAGDEVALELKKADGEIVAFDIEKEYDEPLGVVFNSAVFDKVKICANKCLFCFVDQMPVRMRESLYVKDDDYRLSFLQGSFITLTNLRESDIERIIKDRLSPLYVSVHTTDPELRQQLLKNKRAGDIIPILKKLSAEGIEVHTQVVLCPGVNDGVYLEQTYSDLAGIEGVISLALVPVGLTKYRSGLPELRIFTSGEAESILSWLAVKQEECREKRGTSFIWASDEFYLQAGMPLPECGFYEGFPQLENGVGLVRLFWEEFIHCPLPRKVDAGPILTVVTGVSGEYALAPIMERLHKINGFKADLKVIKNDFFGSSVTVTGLLTGTCLIQGLKGIEKGSKVIIPEIMLKKNEKRFLDDLLIEDVERELEINLYPVPLDGKRLWKNIRAVLGR